MKTTPEQRQKLRSCFIRGEARTEHSAKPEKVQDMIERLYPGPYVELNARRRRPGWLCIGDELPSAAGLPAEEVREQ